MSSPSKYSPSKSSSGQLKSGMCTPLIIYLVLVAFQIAALGMSAKVSPDQKASMMLLNIAIAAFWGVIMYQLCLNGHEGWSWFILLLPLIVALFFWLF